jgi:RES domain
MSPRPYFRRLGAKWESLSPSTDVPAPPDAGSLDPLITVWPAGERMERCHPSTFGAAEFNARAGTPGRFRPVRAGKRLVPTLYAADAAPGAISETVFHDVPVDRPDKRVRIARFETVLLSSIAPRRDLRLVSLHGHGFHRLGVGRATLIESEADCYPQLAPWGQALHDCPADADGLQWRSRHYDDSYACLLFGDRVRRRELAVIAPSLLITLGRGLELLAELAEDAQITLIA